MKNKALRILFFLLALSSSAFASDDVSASALVANQPALKGKVTGLVSRVRTVFKKDEILVKNGEWLSRRQVAKAQEVNIDIRFIKISEGQFAIVEFKAAKTEAFSILTKVIGDPASETGAELAYLDRKDFDQIHITNNPNIAPGLWNYVVRPVKDNEVVGKLFLNDTTADALYRKRLTFTVHFAVLQSKSNYSITGGTLIPLK